MCFIDTIYVYLRCGLPSKFVMRFLFIIILFLALKICFWGDVTIGRALLSLFPRRFMACGGNIRLFIDGRFFHADCIRRIKRFDAFTWRNMTIPVDYRGRFYTIGTDVYGSCYVCVTDIRHYWMVYVAELIRKAFQVPDDEEQMEVGDDDKMEEDSL